jgi:hypothetical protein
MNHDEFVQRLDAAILSGLSNAKAARQAGVNETTIRRRKSELVRTGHVFPNTQLCKPEDNDGNQIPR